MGIPQQGGAMSAQAAASGSAQKRSSNRWLVVVGVLLVLAIIAAAAYFTLSGFFNANGTWYGPMRVKSGVGTVSIETYMDVSTSPTGSISGSGTFCIPLPFSNTSTFDYTLTGNRAFVLPGSSNPQPIAVTAEYTVPVIPLIKVPLGPRLEMKGNVSGDTFHLTGGDSNLSTSLDMKHGSKADFTAACKSLSPLG